MKTETIIPNKAFACGLSLNEGVDYKLRMALRKALAEYDRVHKIYMNTPVHSFSAISVRRDLAEAREKYVAAYEAANPTHHVIF